MWISHSSHGSVQGSGVTAEGITGPPQYASYGGDSYGLKAAGAWSVWLWQALLWACDRLGFESKSSVSERKCVCPGVNKLWGLLHAGAAAHLSVKWKRLLQQSDSHLFSKCSWVIWWADTRSWQYMLKGYWSHQSAWLLLCCSFSCPISSWRTA